MSARGRLQQAVVGSGDPTTAAHQYGADHDAGGTGPSLYIRDPDRYVIELKPR